MAVKRTLPRVAHRPSCRNVERNFLQSRAGNKYPLRTSRKATNELQHLIVTPEPDPDRSPGKLKIDFIGITLTYYVDQVVKC